MQYHQILLNTIKYHVIACNTIKYHAIPLNTNEYYSIAKYHRIPCNTIEYHLIPSKSSVLSTVLHPSKMAFYNTFIGLCEVKNSLKMAKHFFLLYAWPTLLVLAMRQKFHAHGHAHATRLSGALTGCIVKKKCFAIFKLFLTSHSPIKVL